MKKLLAKVNKEQIKRNYNYICKVIGYFAVLYYISRKIYKATYKVCDFIINLKVKGSGTDDVIYRVGEEYCMDDDSSSRHNYDN